MSISFILPSEPPKRRRYPPQCGLADTDTQRVLTLSIVGREAEAGEFCLRCLWEFLGANLPKLVTDEPAAQDWPAEIEVKE